MAADWPGAVLRSAIVATLRRTVDRVRGADWAGYTGKGLEGNEGQGLEEVVGRTELMGEGGVDRESERLGGAGRYPTVNCELAPQQPRFGQRSAVVRGVSDPPWLPPRWP